MFFDKELKASLLEIHEFNEANLWIFSLFTKVNLSLTEILRLGTLSLANLINDFHETTKVFMIAKISKKIHEGSLFNFFRSGLLFTNPLKMPRYYQLCAMASQWRYTCKCIYWCNNKIARFQDRGSSLHRNNKQR